MLTIVLTVLALYLVAATVIGYSSLVLAGRKDREASNAFTALAHRTTPNPPPDPPKDAYSTEWPYRPVRYFDIPTDHRHRHLPMTYAFRWGVTKHDPPLLWMHAHPETLDAIERNLRLNRRPNPYPGLQNPWE